MALQFIVQQQIVFNLMHIWKFLHVTEYVKLSYGSTKDENLPVNK